MAIALTLQEYLNENRIDYDVVEHEPTLRSIETAEAAHISADNLAKSVVLKDDLDYLMAVVPSTYHVKIEELDRELGGHFNLVSESELESIFTDCAPGAIPPFGQAYFIDVIVDKKLMDNRDIYFEAGDHTRLLHISGESFMKLVSNSRHSEFTRHT